MSASADAFFIHQCEVSILSAKSLRRQLGGNSCQPERPSRGMQACFPSSAGTIDHSLSRLRHRALWRNSPAVRNYCGYFPLRETDSRLVFALIASLAVGGCAALARAGLGGAGGFLVAGPPGAVVGAGAGAVGGAVGARCGDEMFLAWFGIIVLACVIWVVLDV